MVALWAFSGQEAREVKHSVIPEHHKELPCPQDASSAPLLEWLEMWLNPSVEATGLSCVIQKSRHPPHQLVHVGGLVASPADQGANTPSTAMHRLKWNISVLQDAPPTPRQLLNYLERDC